MMGNSYINPNINQKNLHPSLEAFLSSTQLAVMPGPRVGKGGAYVTGNRAKATTGYSPQDITEGWILRLKFLPLPQHPTVHEEKTRRRH